MRNRLAARPAVLSLLAFLHPGGLRVSHCRHVHQPTTVVGRILALAEVEGGVVFDLEADDDAFDLAAAKKCGARGVGLDVDPLKIAGAWANAGGRRRTARGIP